MNDELMVDPHAKVTTKATKPPAKVKPNGTTVGKSVKVKADDDDDFAVGDGLLIILAIVVLVIAFIWWGKTRR